MKYILLSILIALSLSGCYTFEYTVGTGAKGQEKEVGKNHYLAAGLILVKKTDPATLAGGATDYNVKVTHRVLDSIVCSLTYGVYCPTTVIVVH